ncbi:MULTISPECIES: hypothetical protein [Aphanothece]|uniref:hypothetical protein n=1 Tax=Aphanothece TaxID=1121 RepID=UPI00398EE2CC
MDDQRRPPAVPEPVDGTCLGSTCMKWQGDGELSPLDLQAILARLSQVDQVASTLMECPVEPQPQADGSWDPS